MSATGAPRFFPGRVRPALLALVAGGVLLVSYACHASSTSDFGSTAAPVPPSSAVAAPASPSASGSSAGGVPIQDGKPAATTDESPVRLRIPALKLNATVDAVGIDPATGDFAVPPSVDQVGWYKFGPGFGATAGSIVIAGHVDSAAEGKGAFFGLPQLSKGDVVTLTGQDGKVRTFKVTARERYRKVAIPLDRYFARDGTPRLTLITCGGPFDSKTGHYRDNVVVTAA